MEDREVLFFPLRNENGFKVDSPESYRHVIDTIISNTLQLQEEFPNNPVLVVYEV